MLRLILPVVLLILGVAGGVGAGMFLGAPADAVAAPEAEAGDETPEDAAAETAAEEEVAPASGTTEFVRQNNQFVVPIVRDGSVRSLVVLSLTLEVDTGQNSAVFDREPRLRDAFLQVLCAHANAGGFDGSFTEAAAMAPLREALGEAAVNILGPVLRDVLIVDITRQDA